MEWAEGPWRVVEKKAEGLDNPQLFVEDAGGSRVARVWAGRMTTRDNAKLLALAPDMMELLMDVEDTKGNEAVLARVKEFLDDSGV